MTGVVPVRRPFIRLAPRLPQTTPMPPVRPVPLPVLVDGIPAALKAVPRWVNWLYDHRYGKWTKVPYMATSPTRKADSMNPATWSTLADSLATYRSGAMDGIGFVLGDGWVGYDYDGAPTSRPRRTIRTLNSYTERSPGGVGIHTLVCGTKPGPHCRTGDHELYDRGRYFTVTGHRLPELPATVEDRTAELPWSTRSSSAPTSRRRPGIARRGLSTGPGGSRRRAEVSDAPDRGGPRVCRE